MVDHWRRGESDLRQRSITENLSDFSSSLRSLLQLIAKLCAERVEPFVHAVFGKNLQGRQCSGAADRISTDSRSRPHVERAGQELFLAHTHQLGPTVKNTERKTGT